MYRTTEATGCAVASVTSRYSLGLTLLMYLSPSVAEMPLKALWQPYVGMLFV